MTLAGVTVAGTAALGLALLWPPEPARIGRPFVYRGEFVRYLDFYNRHRAQATIRLERSTASMTPAERQAVRILGSRKARALDAATADRLRFALAWGDGRGHVSGDPGAANLSVLQYEGFAPDLRGLIGFHAHRMGVTVKDAVGELAALGRGITVNSDGW